MIKLEADMKKELLDIKMEGDVPTLAIETASLVRHIYQGIKETDPTAAWLYKDIITQFIINHESPTWRDDDEGGLMS